MTELYYISTRDNQKRLTASQAILKGISDEGGLFVPEKFPSLNFDWEKLKTASYQTIAKKVLSAFFTDFTSQEIEECVDKAYDQKFDDPKIAPVQSLDGQAYMLELFHGNTIAFKDMALSILPYLMTTAAKKNQLKEEIVILTATSGDTGKAAMAGFADVEGTNIIVFYPKNGVSDIQRLQMITQQGENTKVVAIEGNFDDAQTEVKRMFNHQPLKDTLLANGYILSSANSINIGRLIPQVAYYVYAYAQLVQMGKLVADQLMDVVVPTGNFGNILAAFYAKQIGVPIGKFICASNKNNVLVDFFNTGTYNRNREFYLTSSPSMDIIISSNLERLIYLMIENDQEQLKTLMRQLSENGEYHLSLAKSSLSKQFYANQATEEEINEAIKTVYETYHYTLDPHTAVAYVVYKKYQSQATTHHPTIIAATASPYKFANTVVEAITGESIESPELLIERLNQLSEVGIPNAIANIMNEPVRHKEVASINQMEQSVLNFLKVND